MTIELRDPSLVKRIEQLAAATTQPAERVLENAVETFLEQEALQAEAAVFWKILPRLAQEFSGQAVALREGQVMDHGPDFAALKA